MRRYGIPYKGSKQAIADWVIDHLPPANTLVDLFCGGCAVTHAAMLSGKWENFIANDIQPLAPQLFMDSIHGKYTTTNEKRWISREDFFRLKDSDPYVKYCWSFGNDGATYMYGTEIEPLKKRLHELVFAETVHDRIAAWRAFVHEYNRSSLQRLQSLERLQITTLPYDEVKIEPNSVIYCDPPYKGTSGYAADTGKNKECVTAFDFARFYGWCERQTELVLISEYDMPADRFACVWAAKHVVRCAANTTSHTTERLFTPLRQKATYERLMKAQTASLF